jgi:hypothetical protein
MTHISAKGLVEATVFGRDGSVRVQSRTQKNLILAQGLVGIGIRSWAKSFEHCAIGSSNSSSTISQVMLGAEFDRTSAYVTSTGACGSSTSSNQVTMWRTFLFSTHTGAPVTLGEVGLSWSSQPNAANLFSRLSTTELFDGATVQISEGERVQIKYTLVLTLSPAGASGSSTTLGITNLSPNTATHNWQSACLDGVSGTGGTAPNLALGGVDSCMEPSVASKAFLSSSTALAAFASDVDRRTTSYFKPVTSGLATLQEDGSVKLEKTVVIGSGECTGQVVAAIGLTSPNFPGLFSGYVAVLDSSVTMTSSNSLILTFAQSWGRA